MLDFVSRQPALRLSSGTKSAYNKKKINLMAKKKIKKTWVSVAEIPQNTIYMMSLPIRFFMQEWPKIGLGDKIKEYFSLYEKDFCRMYYPRQEFDEQADFLATKMLSQPAWALRIIGRVERWSRLFMEQSKKIRRQPLKKLTNQQLIQLYKSGEKYQVLSHGIGASVSWHADAEKERVTKAIWQALQEHLQKKGSNLNMADIFSVLTTPPEESFVAKEEKDFLKLAILISKIKNLKRLFFQKNSII